MALTMTNGMVRTLVQPEVSPFEASLEFTHLLKLGMQPFALDMTCACLDDVLLKTFAPHLAHIYSMLAESKHLPEVLLSVLRQVKPSSDAFGMSLR